VRRVVLPHQQCEVQASGAAADADDVHDRIVYMSIKWRQVV
jgi:hypothetical protein